jgi:hypothetical protein
MIRPAAKATGTGVGVRIEILHFQLRELAVAATGFERRPY